MADNASTTATTQASLAAGMKLVHLRDEVLATAGITVPDALIVTSKSTDAEKAAAAENFKQRDEAIGKFYAGFNSSLAVAKTLNLVQLDSKPGETPDLASLGAKIPDHIPNELRPIIREAFKDPAKTAELAQILAQNPKTAELFGKVISQTAANATAENDKPITGVTDFVKRLGKDFIAANAPAPEIVTTILNDPKKIEPLITAIEKNPAVYDAIAQQINNPAAGKGFDPKQLTAIIDYQQKDPATFNKAIATFQAAHDFGDTHPNLAKLAAQGSFDLSKLPTKEDVDKSAALLDILQKNPKVADLAESIAAKTPAGTEAPNDLLDSLKDPEKAGPVAEKFNALLENHPGIGAFIADNYNPKDGVGTSDTLKNLIDNPEEFDKINDALNNNPDLEALLTGKADLGAIVSNPSAFLKRNHSLLTLINNDKIVASLLNNSQFAKDHPDLVAQMEDKGTQKLLSLFGLQDKPEPDAPGTPATEQSPLMALCSIIENLFSGKPVDWSQAATSIAKVMQSGELSGVGSLLS